MRSQCLLQERHQRIVRVRILAIFSIDSLCYTSRFFTTTVPYAFDVVCLHNAYLRLCIVPFWMFLLVAYTEHSRLSNTEYLPSSRISPDKTLISKRPSLRRFNTFSYLGSDEPEVSESGRSKDNVFKENTIIGGLESIKIKEADGTQFIDNSFKDASTIRFVDATKTLMLGNTGLDDSTLKIASGASFDKGSDHGFEPTT